MRQRTRLLNALRRCGMTLVLLCGVANSAGAGPITVRSYLQDVTFDDCPSLTTGLQEPCNSVIGAKATGWFD